MKNALIISLALICPHSFGLLRARISSVSLTTAGIPLSLPFESQVELRAFTPGQVIQP